MTDTKSWSLIDTFISLTYDDKILYENHYFLPRHCEKCWQANYFFQFFNRFGKDGDIKVVVWKRNVIIDFHILATGNAPTRMGWPTIRISEISADIDFLEEGLSDRKQWKEEFFFFLSFPRSLNLDVDLKDLWNCFQFSTLVMLFQRSNFLFALKVHSVCIFYQNKDTQSMMCIFNTWMKFFRVSLCLWTAYLKW